MKTILLVLLCAVIALALDDVDIEFRNFQLKFKRSYRSQSEMITRKIYFKQSLDAINRQNADYENGLSSYRAGVNEFADRSQKEMAGLLGAKLPENLVYSERINFKSNLLTNKFKPIDHRKYYNITYHQGQCGSCWAFSAALALAMDLAIKTNGSVQEDLSEQFFVDCVNRSKGCDGGWPTDPFDYVKNKLGMALEKNYNVIKLIYIISLKIRILNNFFSFLSTLAKMVFAKMHH